MSKRLPEFVDPWRSADQGKRFSGRVELARLPRLATALKRPSGEVEFELRFERDSKRRSRIKGFVRSVLVVECQRCLGALSYPVDLSLDLAAIEVAAEAERLPEEIEPVQVEEGVIRLLDMVEDELILAIPQVPMHGEGDCETDMSTLGESYDPGFGAGTNSDDELADNPFAVLSKLKTDLNC